MHKIIIYILLVFPLCINTNEISITPLIEAACGNNISLLQQLLDEGQDINETNTYNITPLSMAVFLEKEEATEYLLKKGANTELPSQTGFTALWTASGKKNIKITRLLLTYGANFLYKRENSSLVEIIKSDHEYNDILQELVNYGHWRVSDDFDEIQKKTVYPLSIMILHKFYKNNRIDQVIDRIQKEDLIAMRNHLVHYATCFLPFDEKMKIYKKINTQNNQQSDGLINEIAQQHAYYYVTKWKQELGNPAPVEINQEIIISNMAESFRLLLKPQSAVK